jgi:hypothetical protein
MCERARLQRTWGRLRNAMIVGFGLFLMGLVLHAGFQQPLGGIICILGFGIIFFSMMLAHKGALRCEACQGNLGPLVVAHGSFAQFFYFCPFCGNNLTAETKKVSQSEDSQTS